MNTKKPSHLNSAGGARMVDVGDKPLTPRVAVAEVTVQLNREAFELARTNASAKGALLTVAEIAGIQAAKRTADVIPLCHQVPLDAVSLKFAFDDDSKFVIITATVNCDARTGVEMEALHACAVAALTVYDMLKAVQRDIVISDLRVLRKSGGATGDYQIPGKSSENK
ncbi:MAG TPA: cyclic pyranopterin monophosphate synthase MoaC [candidate division Zixibacteria bacterium]|nr:cyclic pyranopterin monophosphate synthase MoaC [candidate division Zixibacteria bacterium]